MMENTGEALERRGSPQLLQNLYCTHRSEKRRRKSAKLCKRLVSTIMRLEWWR
jgi:hypothetical protein